ncbi:hemerythrin domain-containing protein [Streptomyces hydrogenans]|uniref:hemerythrin domain-containing protein n=1 Tax=Streptomyces hydrogenans TaxID=1873719 RepID=UPI0035D57BE0
MLLREDHKTVEKLFKTFEKTNDEDTAERRRIVDEVIEELTVHAWIEEHHAVVWMLSELKTMDASHERFKAKMSVLMEQVRHHVEEEQDWLPDVRRAMGRNRLQEFGAQLEGAKGQAPRDPLKVPSAASK